MDLKELREGLKKSRDPEKFLMDLLEKTKDKKLKELIKQLLEKKRAYGESKLENVVRTENVILERKEPPLSINIPEVIEKPVEVKIAPELQKEDNVDYGIKGGGDYATGSTYQQLEQSNMIASDGHIQNAETQGIIQEKMGAYSVSDNQKDKYKNDEFYASNMGESSSSDSTFDSVLGKKKKKRMGDYV